MFLHIFFYCLKISAENAQILLSGPAYPCANGENWLRVTLHHTILMNNGIGLIRRFNCITGISTHTTGLTSPSHSPSPCSDWL